jgi:predicted Zn-dependent protease
MMDLGALAPDEPEVAEEPMMDLASLAPDEPEVAEEPMMDLASLAPDEPEVAEEPVMDLAAFAPDEPAAVGDILSEEAADAPLEEFDEPPIYTRTIAELYVTQGAVDRAIDVYRNLVAAEPDDPHLSDRLAELSAQAAGEGGNPAQAGSEVDNDAGVESLARDLAASGDDTHEVDTPFAWTEEGADEDPTDAPPISDYFSQMQDWKPGRGDPVDEEGEAQ